MRLARPKFLRKQQIAANVGAKRIPSTDAKSDDAGNQQQGQPDGSQQWSAVEDPSERQGPHAIGRLAGRVGQHLAIEGGGMIGRLTQFDGG